MNLKGIEQAIKAQCTLLGINLRTASKFSGIAVNAPIAIESSNGNPKTNTL